MQSDDDPDTKEELRNIYRSMLFGWTKCDDPVTAQEILEHMIEEGMKVDSFCFDKYVCKLVLVFSLLVEC